jgi:two-component system, OmpR family, phosphate regulon response regulator PhoB
MKKNVLVVEDSDIVAKLVCVTLEPEGYCIRRASSGSQALSLAGEVRPDVVILDISMPGAIDGVSACRLIKAQYGNNATRAIMLSARGSPKDVQSAAEAGADEYLVKPFSPRQLLDSVKKFMLDGNSAA